MLEYDYLIERNMGNGNIQKFGPNQIPTKMDNLVLIEGKNSSGKSTLLNLIALGLYGTKNPRINPALQGKLESLLDVDHQKIKYSISISSETDSLILKAEKNSLDKNDYIVKESMDGKTYKPISPENFESKYNLIYDIPNNPTERLNELLKDVKEEQLNIGSKIREFNHYLDKIVTEISNSRNIERLNELKTRLTDVETQKEKITSDLPLQESFLDNLEKRAYIQYFSQYTSEGEKLSLAIDDLRNSITDYKYVEKRKNNTLTKERVRISNLKSHFGDKFTELTPVIGSLLSKKDKYRFQIWEKIMPYSPEYSDLQNAKTEIKYYQQKFSKELDEMRKDSSLQDAKTWEKIVESLEQFEDSRLQVPQFKVTLGEFIKLLKEDNKKRSHLLEIYNLLGKINSDLEELDLVINDIDNTTKKYDLDKSSDSDEDNDEEGLNQKQKLMEEYEAKLNNYANKCNEYLQKCKSKNIDENKLESGLYEDLLSEILMNKELYEYISLGEKHVTQTISELQKDITNKRSRITGFEMLITQYKRDIQNLEKQKPHKFESKLSKINRLLRKTNEVSQKILVEYNSNVKNLIDKKIKKEQIKTDNSKKTYYYGVSIYLANRLGNFKYINKFYKAQIVDLINNTITADNLETHLTENIRLLDFGTGEGQSALLQSLLNIDIKSDNRKIIALFDEIAMMDDESLKPIITKLKELKDQNRLLLGVLVQRSNMTKITRLG